MLNRPCMYQFPIYISPVCTYPLVHLRYCICTYKDATYYTYPRHVRYKAGRILQSPVMIDSRQPNTYVVPHQRMAPTDCARLHRATGWSAPVVKLGIVNVVI